MNFSNVRVTSVPVFAWCVEGGCIYDYGQVISFCDIMGGTIITIPIKSVRIPNHVTIESIIEKYKDYSIVIYLQNGKSIFWVQDTDEDKFNVIRITILDGNGEQINCDCSDL